MTRKEFYRQLVRRYRDGIASDDELEVFAHLMEKGKLDVYLNELFDEELEVMPRKRITWYHYAAAALCVFFIASAVWYWQDNSQRFDQENIVSQDLKPARDRAILNLADGRQVVLDSSDGVLRVDASVISDDLGQVLYDGDSADKVLAYHHIEVPRGGKYQIALSDGTKVWLNAGSSLKFPVQFLAGERSVELQGEAFFDVTKAKTSSGEHVPFLVKTNRQTVEVLGTSFNISASTDGNAEVATLLTGRVKIRDNESKKDKILIPGQQAVFQRGKDGFAVRIADLELVTAWKDGFFLFNKTPIQEVLRQMSLWYDVEIDYSGDKDYAFNGTIGRDVVISKVISMLIESGDFEVTRHGKNISVNQMKRN